MEAKSRGSKKLRRRPANVPEQTLRYIWQSTSADIYGAVGIAYLRAAQAYMLISMPTGTSTILGAFQAIADLLHERRDRSPRERKNRTSLKIAQARIRHAHQRNNFSEWADLRCKIIT
jgi:hypothetical protein